MTLQERAILAKRMLLKQQPITYEEAKTQIALRKAQRTLNNTKKGFDNPNLSLDKK